MKKSELKLIIQEEISKVLEVNNITEDFGGFEGQVTIKIDGDNPKFVQAVTSKIQAINRVIGGKITLLVNGREVNSRGNSGGMGL